MSKAERLICPCGCRLWKISVTLATKTIHLTCSKCGRYQKIEPPSAKEILIKNRAVVEEVINKMLEKRSM